MYEKIIRQDQNPLGYGTTLPASPYDGQEFVLVDSTSAAGYVWRLRYNATLGKWEWLGGSPKWLQAAPNAVVNTQTQVGATGYYRNTGTDFVIPYGGIWVVEAEFVCDPNGAALFFVLQSFAGSAANNDFQGGQATGGAVGAGNSQGAVVLGRVSGVAAGATIGAAVTTSVLGTHKIVSQNVRIYPWRIV